MDKTSRLWRNVRRFSAVLACAAILIALYYAEENWRGKHAWEKYKHALEAKGEKFNLKDFIPPSPPIDQNFATAPVIASCYESVVDITGHVVRPHLTNVVDRLEMPITADNEKNIPTNADWFKGIVTDLSIWQAYYRRLAATTNLFPVPPTPGTAAADVLYALAKYNPTLEEVRAASQLPYAQFPLEYDKDNPADILLTHLGRMKNLVRLLQLRSIAELQNSESDQALEDVRLAFFLQKPMRVEPFLISQFVRIAEHNITLQSVYEGLAGHRWTDTQLSVIDAELAQLDYLADFEYSMHGERVLQTSTLEYLRRTRNMDLFEVLLSTGIPQDPPRKISFYLMPSSAFYRAELFFCQMDEQWLFTMVDPVQHLVSPTRVRDTASAITDSLKKRSFQNRLANLFFSDLIIVVKRFARAQSSVDLARVAIALERYRLAHGELPDSLDSLAPQFINVIPHDVINGRPLNYRRMEDGQFTLYSVGWNETDEGGARGTGKEHNALYDTGDLVWSYPAK